jgi:radical SAM superfamily enzyme YgiQ (UPF0313 family)
MKVCLISPPYNSAVKSVVGISSPPLGLAYLASVLRKDHDVRIIDSNILEYSIEDLRRKLKSFNPDIVGITSVTPSIPQAYDVAKIAKEVKEDSIVVVGGPHVTFLPEQTLRECKDVDVIVKGEGEKITGELATAIENGEPLENVRGIAFRKEDKVVNNEPMPFIRNIDEIPFPSRDLLPVEKYQVNGTRYTAMITSRGCPFRCSFCSSSRLFGGCWRGRSPENVLDEMRVIYEDYDTKNIEFVDDTFTLNQKRAEQICDGIIKEGWDVSWGASSRVDTITRKLAEKMKKAGCWILFLGIESGCQRILDAMWKGITVEQIKRAVKMIKNAGIQVLGSFIIGFPEDTMESIKQTIDFAKSLNLDYAEFSILTPYPGSPIFNFALENDLLLTEDWSKYTAIEPVMKIKDLTEKQLKSFLQKAYISLYLRPKTVWSWIKNRQFTFIKSGIKTVINYLKGR